MIDIINAEFPSVEALVGLEARGFIFGATLGIALGLPFVPIRKPGKLPGTLLKQEYAKEYGKDIFEIQKDSITPGQKVLILDDLLATGGTLAAACDLLVNSGANVLGSLVVIELEDLGGRKKVTQPVRSVLTFN